MQLGQTLRDDGITVLKLAGRMDIEGTGAIELKLTAAAAADGAHVILDLSDVGFMSSLGMGLLVRLAKTVRHRNGEIVLLNPQPMVRLALTKTGIPGVLSIHDTLDAASAAVRGTRP